MSTSRDYYADNDDLRFYVERGFDWDPIVRLTEHELQAPDSPKTVAEAVSSYKDILSLVGGFVAETIGSRTLELDKCHPKLVNGEVVYPAAMTEVFDAVDALGIHGLCVPREYGGLNAPLALFQMTNELFSRADVSITAHYGFHGGMAMAGLVYSMLEGTTRFDRQAHAFTETRFRKVVDDVLQNNAWGSMDITEPHAGSDMAMLRTKGTLQADGTWRVSGSKTFITSGHGRWHYVIARTDGEGLEGLSMFLVEAFGADGVRAHSRLDSVEHKLGHHGSATVGITFDEAPAELIGQCGEGFKYMLMLMNNARIGVGFESLGLAEAALRQARAYAATRPSMGKTIDRHEMIAELLDGMDLDVKAIRAMAMAASWHEEIQRKLDLRLRFDPPQDDATRTRLERELSHHRRKARDLTPLLKYYASEKAVEIARKNVQIHGGAGYMVEYGAEKLLRDAMVLPIYEGTSQIQSLMAMKDTLMGVVKHPRSFLRDQTKARWQSVSARDPHERRVAKLTVAKLQAVQYLLTRLAGTKVRELRGVPMGDWTKSLQSFDPKKDFALAMLHAERLTKILTDEAIAQVLLEQARKFPERAPLLDRWLDAVENRVQFTLTEITTTGDRVLQLLAEQQASAQAAK
jgi:alkylation response protein AidB-like acyl-CoA dehydrogenase